MTRGRSEGRAFAVVTGLSIVWLAFDLCVIAYGQSPGHMLAVLYGGTWGSAYGLGQVLFKATPLLFTGAAASLALRAGLFNIGVEGQLVVAGLASAWAGARLPPGVPHVIAVPVVLCVAASAGALWAAVPAVLRARQGVHEVITTIMTNRIATAAVSLVLASGLALPGTVRTRAIVAGATLPRASAVLDALSGSALSAAFPLALTVVFAERWAAKRTVVGRELALVRDGAEACRSNGVPVRQRLAQAMLASGAVAGLGAAATVLGHKGYFEEGLGAGAGFSGLAVAILARGSATGLVVAALLFGTLDQGGLVLNAHVPREIMDVLAAVLLCAVGAAEHAARRAPAASREDS